MKILLVEDDKSLNRSMERTLQGEGYEVITCFDGLEGYELATQHPFDLLILDRMLPKMDGIEITERLRRAHVDTPIIFVTALDSVENRVQGLDVGADDYLVKPFATSELLARVRAVTRRKLNTTDTDKLVFDEIEIHSKDKSVVVKGTEIEMTKTERELLEYLILNKNRILTKDQIYERIWGFNGEAGEGIVDLYIHYLRKKFASFGYEKSIQTVRGVGYLMKESGQHVK